METTDVILASVVFMVITLVFGGIGAGLLISHKAKKERCTVRSIGVVVDNRLQSYYDSDGDHSQHTYRPVFQIGDVQAEYNIGSGRPKYQIGDEIELYYNPDDKTDFYLEHDKTITVFAAVFISIAAIMIFLEMLMLAKFLTQ
jgi:hypothetical protein